MTKKKRKSGRTQMPRLSPAQLVRPGQEGAEGKQAAPAAPSIPTAKLVARALPDLREEYRYVVTDLKRIAIIAAAMLVVMILLALWLV